MVGFVLRENPAMRDLALAAGDGGRHRGLGWRRYYAWSSRCLRTPDHAGPRHEGRSSASPPWQPRGRAWPSSGSNDRSDIDGYLRRFQPRLLAGVVFVYRMSALFTISSWVLRYTLERRLQPP